MKKRSIFLISALILLFNSSCNDELDDELFTKFVLLTNNGWIDEDMEIPETGILEIPILLGVNGTSRNDRDVSVTLQWDPDTLEGYNFEKYRNQTDLYYSECTEGSLAFSEESILIPAGSEKGVSSIKVDLNKLADPYKDYVIPISIKNVSDYEIGEAKYSKELLHLALKNDYSGNYTGEAKVREVGGGEMTIATKTLYAVKSHEDYFFAGNMDRSSLNRAWYVVSIKFDKNGDILEVEGVNPDLEFTLLDKRMTITHIPNELDARKESIKSELYLKYQYKNLGSESKPTMEFEGTLTKLETVILK